MKDEIVICGIGKSINFDPKIKNLYFELIHVGGDVNNSDGYHAIQISANETDTKEFKLIKFHITEAIEFKAIIDHLIYEALTEPASSK